jgi:hypothetical protein
MTFMYSPQLALQTTHCCGATQERSDTEEEAGSDSSGEHDSEVWDSEDEERHLACEAAKAAASAVAAACGKKQTGRKRKQEQQQADAAAKKGRTVRAADDMPEFELPGNTVPVRMGSRARQPPAKLRDGN